MKARYFYLSLILVILFALIVSAILINQRSKQTVEELYTDALNKNGELSSFKVKRYIEDRATILQEIAGSDVMVNSVMGSQIQSGELLDFFQKYQLIGEEVPIFVYDFLGNLIHKSKFKKNQPFNINDVWFEKLMSSERELIVLPYIEDENVYFSIAIPILYNQLPEGVIIAILPTPLNALIESFNTDNNQFAHVYGPYFDHGIAADVSEFDILLSTKIEGTPLSLDYLVSKDLIQNQSIGFLMDMMISILVSLFFTFVILAIFGRQYLLNPYEKLKQSQAHLLREQDLNTLLSQAINASPIGITIADTTKPDQPLIYVNDYFKSLTGYSEEDVMGKNCRFLQGAETNKEARKIIRHTLENTESIDVELLNYRKDGSEFWEKLSLSPIFKDGKCRAYVGIQQDISDEIQSKAQLIQAKEVAEHATKAKSEFLANMSHEIRTPMNGVLGMLKLVQKSKDLTRDQRHQINLAHSSAESLLVVINDILDFSKIEAGKISLEHIEFDLLDWISEISESMAYHAHKKGIDLALDVSEVSLYHLVGDPNRIRQIISNLLGNAIKFTEEGSVIIKLSTEQKPDETVRLVCSIRDTGIGIPEERLGKLFTAFEQVDSSTTRRFGGTGLGLTIAKKLCELMGGKISVSSQMNEGSCFYFYINLCCYDTKTLTEQIPQAFKDKHALVVDHNELSRDTVASMLRDWGLIVQTCSSASALEKTLDWHKQTREPLHYLFLDSKENGINRPSFIENMFHKGLVEQCKVILMMRIIDEVDAEQIRAQGFGYYFPKPATPLDLLKSLNDEMQPEPDDNPHHSIETFDANVLLVEDNPINQEIACSILEDLGVKVTVANNGKIALETLSEANHAFDLILMDCQMPILDGYKTSEAIRNGLAGGDVKMLPIIAMTANAMEGDKERCLESGMNDYLSKPIDIDLLITKLRRYLASSVS